MGFKWRSLKCIERAPLEPDNYDEASFHFELKAFDDKIQELIKKFLEKILAFNYARDTEEQIIEIRKWLEAKQK